MKEQNKNRLATITGRYASRQREKAALDRRAFDEAFVEVREKVLRPVFEDIADELRGAGHTAVVAIDGATETPSIELVLGIGGNTTKDAHDRVAFVVITRRPAPEVLAYLVVRPPALDLVRFASPSDITAEQVEQILVDAVEHIFACHSV
ncbi:hypothetical protein [Polyangium jinanense]|uniref:Uncharacterized protein n=1 Tax=Polyangium jinanense TaxID=2829994 RepID=A0A9X3WXY4_9BACT|nr:hypothetical protein [Polyangium jinanense]MDC3952519.1 hypothetical protein [Polyangium jinanense]MDC3980147.1 hypothetical protein [Polyangium jinanense]